MKKESFQITINNKKEKHLKSFKDFTVSITVSPLTIALSSVPNMFHSPPPQPQVSKYISRIPDQDIFNI